MRRVIASGSIILILVAGLCPGLRAQDIDSLYQTYLSLASAQHEKRDYASALEHYTKALNLTREKSQQLHCLIESARVLVDSTDYQGAQEFLDRALELNRKADILESYPRIYNLRGMCYGLSGNMDLAIEAFENALGYNEELENNADQGLSHYNIGLAMQFKGSYDQAVEHYILSARFREITGDTTLLVTSLTAIGGIFRIKEEFEKADAYFTEALSHRDHIHNQETLAFLYSEIALVNKEMRNYDRAMGLIDTAMVYCQTIGYKRGIVTLTAYRADIQYELGNLEKALALYRETIPGYEAISFEPGTVQTRLSMAEILMELGEPAEALDLLDMAESGAQKNTLLEEETRAARLKYSLHGETGEYKKALEEAEYYIHLKDSLLNMEREKKITEIETRYQTERKEKQIELLDRENQIKAQKIRSRTILLLGLVLIAILLVASGILLFKRRQISSRLAIEQSRHRLLRSQMNPHFMYNALSAIQNFILQNQAMDSVSYISDFSGLMRLVLEGSRQDMVPLKDDIALITNYLNLQKLRFNHSFDFEVRVGENIHPDLVSLPPMLSQPFIENAVEHGMRKLAPGEGRIGVDYSLEGAELHILVSDNGEGIRTPEKNEGKKHRSLATTITRERIDNLKKTLGIDISLDIRSGRSGTRIEIIIPQKQLLKK